MSHYLLAMGVGSATTESAPVAEPATSSGSMTIVIVALLAVAAIVILAYFMSKSKQAVA